MDTMSMLPRLFLSVCIYFTALLIVFVTDYNSHEFTRLHGFNRAKPFRRGIGGKKDTDPELSQQRRAKLFSTIVQSGAGVVYKKGLGVSKKFINWNTRGKAVAIGPLEYCGSGIPLSRSHGRASGAKKKGSEKEKVL